jgi:hemerythrin superfamily protein
MTDEDADVFAVLVDDHQAITWLFEQIDEHCDHGELGEAVVLLDVVLRRLVAHAKAEEWVIYPCFAELGPMAAAGVRDALADHAELERLASALAELDPHHVDWHARVSRLATLFHKHVAFEELQLFDVVRDELSADDVVDLATEFELAKLVIEGDGIDVDRARETVITPPP